MMYQPRWESVQEHELTLLDLKSMKVQDMPSGLLSFILAVEAIGAPYKLIHAEYRGGNEERKYYECTFQKGFELLYCYHLEKL